MNRKHLLCLLFIFLMAIPVACGNQSGETVTPGAGTSYDHMGPQQNTPSPEPTELPTSTPTPSPTVTPEPEVPSIKIAWWGKRYRNESTIAVINLYREKNPDIVIEYEALSLDEYFTKLDTMKDSKEVWDVFQIKGDPTPYRELMMPLNSYIDNGSIEVSDISKVFLELTEDENGNQLGICAGLDTDDKMKSSQMLCVSQKSKYPEEAVKFINFFLHDIEANRILRAERGIPISQTVRDALSEGLTEEEKQPYVDANQYGAQTQNEQSD